MRYIITSIFIFIVAVIFFSPNTLAADSSVNVSNNGANSHTSVDVESNTGQNTICQNGKCTTTGSNNGSSHVCVNGKCFDSSDGNVNYKSEDGNTNIHINNNSGETLGATSAPVNNTIAPSAKPDTSNSFDKDSKEITGKKNEIQQKLNDLQNKVKNDKKKADEYRNVLQEIIDGIKNFFDNLFKK